MTTIKDISKYTGLSVGTISKYINGINVKPNNKIKIDDAITKFNFRVNENARILKSNDSKCIGIMIDSFNGSFITSILSELDDKISKINYANIICEVNENKNKAISKLEQLLSRRCNAIVYLSGCCENEVIEICNKNCVPIILVDSVVNDINLIDKVDCIVTNNAKGAFDAVDVFVKNHHENIAVITGESQYFSANERIRGFTNGLKAHSLPFDAKNIIREAYTIDGGYKSIKRLIANDTLPTALLICNDQMTIGALLALKENGISIPDDVSIISFDDEILFKLYNPTISAIKQDISKIVDKIIERLIVNLENKNKKNNVFMLDSSFIIRESIKNRSRL